ncbi:BTAD domain-containing putative transcriptional regulator [Knoellia sp. S7-12]|uniref:nSTAND1 domain-containing NTPase n=1 Tax=Knoellia sp. S7-12 TaxID=3126698 RepID=UPI00336960E1
MGIAVLGPLLVDDRAALSPRDQVVLEALVVAGGKALSTEQLADALWGDSPPASWTKLIPSSILRIRKVLGTGSVETTSHGYRLADNSDTIDAVRFGHLVERGHQLLAAGDPDRARHVLRDALALWRGRALAELADWEPGRFEAERLDEVRREAEEAVLDASLRAGLHAEVVAEARSRVAQEPLRERRWALLALAQYLAGDQADALETLRGARRRLADELGLDPGAEIVKLEEAMLRQDSSLVAAVALPEPSPECPYPGLRSFDVAEGELYFGRGSDLSACLSRLDSEGVLVVVGPSGSGKSSLVRAGVGASLRRSQRPVEILAPGPDPAAGLRAVVASKWRGTLVVDQFEEVLAACDDEARDELIDCLIEQSRSGRLVLTLRADHLGDIAGHADLSRLVERGLYLLGPMGEADLRVAVEGPAAEAALILEPGLVDMLVGEVLDAPGALPLMAHALEQTWQRREGRTLTVAGYRDSGGIAGAVAQTAEGVYDELDVGGQTSLRDLLLRLVTVTPDGDPVRVWVPLRQLTPDAGRGLVELLARARLLTVAEGGVAVAHESLARAWPRLRAWLEDDVEGQRILRHLAAAADSWDGLGQPESELYRGVRLSRAVEWRARASGSLTSTEEAFLEASEQVDRAVREQEAAEELRHRRHRRTTRVLVAGLVTVLLVTASIAGVAVVQQGRAAEAALAQRAATAVSASLESTDPTVALLTAVEALRLRDGPDTRRALLTALTRWPALLASRNFGAARDVAVAADGSVVVGQEEELTVVDPVTLADRVTGAGASTSLAVLPSGGRVVVADEDGTVAIVNPESGERVLLRSPHGRPSWGLETSADGSVIVAGVSPENGRGHHVLAWRGTTPLASLLNLEITDFALSPDGSRIYVHLPLPVPTVAVHDVATGRRIAVAPVAEARVLPPSAGVSEPLAISPDGRTLAVGGAEVSLVDTTTLAVERRMANPVGETISLAFSRDGRQLAGGSDERAFTVWEVQGPGREQLDGLSEAVNEVAFAADGRTVYTLTNDRRLSAWDIAGDRRAIPRLRAELGPGLVGEDLVMPAPDGDVVAFMSSAPGADTITFLDVETGRLLGPVEGSYRNWGVWRPPEHDHLAVPGDRSIRVWDWQSRATVLEEEVDEGPIEALAYAPDGRRLIVGERFGVVYEVDAETLKPVGPRVEVDGDLHVVIWAGPGMASAFTSTDSTGTVHSLVNLRDGKTVATHRLPMEVTHADVSPDGELLALGGDQGEVGILDLTDGSWVKEPLEGQHQGYVLRVDFSSDGALLVSSGEDGRVRLWNGRSGSKGESVTVGRVGVPSSAIFEPGGHILLLASGDGSVQRWDTTRESWVRHACRTAGRNLTADEWSLIFGSTIPVRAGCSPEQLRGDAGPTLR